MSATALLLHPTNIPGVVYADTPRYSDERGYFTELWNEALFAAAGITNHWVQDNLSFSRRGTVRGLHFQTGAFAQAKLVRALTGRILDVGVDLRCGSPTYGRHFAVELTPESGRVLYMPKGIAHGFAVLSDGALFHYKCDAPYSPEHQGGLAFDDPALAISWPIPPEQRILSDADRRHPPLSQITPWRGEPQ